MIENGFGFWMLEVRIVEAVEHTVWLLVMVAMMKACPLVMMFKMGMQSQAINVQALPCPQRSLQIQQLGSNVRECETHNYLKT